MSVAEVTRNEDMISQRLKGVTLEEIGQQYGVSRQRVEQITKSVGAFQSRRMRRESFAKAREAKLAGIRDAVLADYKDGLTVHEVREKYNLNNPEWRYLAAQMDEFTRREARGCRELRDRVFDDEAILLAIRDCAAELGKTPGINAFKRYIGNSLPQLATQRFGSWRAACIAAGLEPNRRPSSPLFGAKHYSDADVKKAYRRIRKLAERPPSVSDWRDLRNPYEITEHAIRKRYGRWMVFIEEMEKQ